jgi:acetoin utilization protein AcuC
VRRNRTLVVWDDALLGYDMGEHPLDPVRVELTMALAREMGIFARPGVEVVKPEPADDELLHLVHTPAYVTAVKAQAHGYGLHTPDNPVFPGMHEASALIAGATVAAAEAVWKGNTPRAVSIMGGLHHAMPEKASGFCVYNDPAIAIARLLQLGAERVAYLDVDVHHGDGVQAVFSNDPRVLTVSLHETPLALFPGTGFPTETGGPAAPGSAVNVALPPGTGDEGWLRAFHAIVPSVVRAFDPQVIVSQCGADSHRLDPLADLQLTVDGQREAYLEMKALADELCDGRWVVTGGGGYALVEAVPRAWTHLLAIATGVPLDPTLPIPDNWQNLAHRRRPGSKVPTRMTDGGLPRLVPWEPTGEPDPVDREIQATRRAVFPLTGLDPDDPRD